MDVKAICDSGHTPSTLNPCSENGGHPCIFFGLPCPNLTFEDNKTKERRKLKPEIFIIGR